MKLKVLDLFSGIGGFSLGLERAGMETVAFCEIDDHCKRVLKKNWPSIPIISDVTRLDGYTTKQLLGKIDVICGGFPCQDISIAGKKEGIKDGTRSGLWNEYKRIIKEIKPKYVIIENVANLRVNGLATVLQDLWKIGYCAEWHIISARSVGANHLRERIWIIAYPDSPRLEGSRKTRDACEICTQAPISASTMLAAYSNNFRLWKSFATEEEKSEWWTETTSSFRDWWQVESPICRVDDGLPLRLDKHSRAANEERIRKERIRQLGNSVIPQIPEIIGRAILEYEEVNG